MGVSLNPMSYFGKGRRTADAFRTNYQDPFHKDVAGILDPLTAAREAGTLTFDQVSTAEQAFEDRLSKFSFDADAFAVKGGEQGNVVAQARETLDPIIAQWRAGFKRDRTELGPKLEVGKIPTMDSILANRSAKTAAEQAKEQQRKRSQAGGYMAAVLTKFKGTTGTTTRPKTATGY